jgi:hypothetical protein
MDEIFSNSTTIRQRSIEFIGWSMGALLAEMRSNINLRRLISDGIPDTQSITLAGKLKDELKQKLISLASISEQLEKTPEASNHVDYGDGHGSSVYRNPTS